MPLLPGSRVGVYEVVAHIGEGGMGEVYRARDTKLNREVALKLLPESFAGDSDRLARFTREAQTLAALNHPHIAAIYGLEESTSLSALVMELVEGDDLSVRIARGPIPLDEALPIAKQIADALEAAHEQGIIHRDLKPANIKVRPDGTIKVLDFGLAKTVGPSDRLRQGSGGQEAGPHVPDLSLSPTMTSPAMTAMGVILGTAAYMAPEQAKGKAVDKRADIWAFGAVLYEMLAGTRAFHGEDVSDLLVAVLSKDVDLSALPAVTPRSIVRLIQSCLARDPKNRLRDIGDARLAIAEALAPGTEPAAPALVAHESRRWQRVSIGLAAVATVLAVALALGQRARPIAEAVDPPVLRFGLVDNPNIRINTTMTQPLAASADGRTIVFCADAGTGLHLWVRTLDQPEPRMLAGTDGAWQPAISPDGEWVAFVVANHIIRKIRLSGGSPTTVVSHDDLTAALAWASNDRIVFEKIGSKSGIHHVSANGGQPELLIPLEANETGARRPVVLRASGLVLYTSTVDGRAGLVAFSLADGRRRRLDVDGIQALGMIDGHLVYARSDGILLAVPFDARDMRALGAPRQLDERVTSHQVGTAVTLSENGTLVFTPPVSPQSRLMLGDADGRTRGVGSVARAFESPRFSPDGRRIAVGIADGEGRELWVVDIASAEAVRVTRGGKGAMRLEAWAADGKALVYTRGDELWTAAVDGSAEPRKLVETNAFVMTGGSLLPDGRSIVVAQRIRSADGTADREELVRLSLAGDAAARPIITSRSAGSMIRAADPRVSPDGKWVALQDRNERQIHVRALEGGAGVQVSDGGGDLPVWGRDSRRLFYQTSAGLMVADLRTLPELAVVGRRPGPAFPIASTMHDLSPDGKTFLLTVPVDGSAKVMVNVNWATSVRQQLARPR